MTKITDFTELIQESKSSPQSRKLINNSNGSNKPNYQRCYIIVFIMSSFSKNLKDMQRTENMAPTWEKGS